MPNLLTRKLEGFVALDQADRALLDEIVRTPHAVPSRTDLIREGDKPEMVQLVLEGFACRYKLTKRGRRQIMAYLVPGDFCDLHVFVLRAMDHSIATLSPCKIVHIPRDRVLELIARPKLSLALWYAALVDAATLREWLLNIGQRPAEQRIGHLLCELLLRLRVVELADGNSYELPITQEEIGDTTGLSAVHVNRALQSLRAEKLITLKSKRLVILDGERLAQVTGFDPNYLHLAEQNGERERAG